MIRAHTVDGRQIIFSASQVNYCQEIITQFASDYRKDREEQHLPVINHVDVWLKGGTHFVVRDGINALVQQIEEEELAKA